MIAHLRAEGWAEFVTLFHPRWWNITSSLSHACSHKGYLESSSGGITFWTMSNMLCIFVVYVDDGQKPSAVCEAFPPQSLSGRWYNPLFFLDEFHFPHNRSPKFHCTSLYCRKSHRLFDLHHRHPHQLLLIFVTFSKKMAPRMPTLESMWFAFGNKWMTMTIVFPHTHRIVLQQPLWIKSACFLYWTTCIHHCPRRIGKCAFPSIPQAP